MSFEMRAFAEHLCRFRSTAGEERAAADWVETRLADLGFETYTWDADPGLLTSHPSFPNDSGEIDVAGRRSVAGVLEVGDVDGRADGPTGDAASDASDSRTDDDGSTDDASLTVVLNGHLDVVPAEPTSWSSDPFEPVWRSGEGRAIDRGVGGGDPSSGDVGGGETLTARGAADMKSGVAACVGAALDVRDAAAAGVFDPPESGLRIVVEAVAGEEDGGYGAATAALESPYPFKRDAAIVAEPTKLRPVVACEGCLMAELRLVGRSAHAATRWRGEDVLPRFETIRRAFGDLERERAKTVTHPLFDEFPVPWPVVCGTVDAGSWASTVPASLTAAFRIGVAPSETVDGVERAFRERLGEVADDDPWLREHPPTFERFSVQFEPSEVPADAPVVKAIREGLVDAGLPDAEPVGATYGTDARHYIEAGIPTVVFGPGTIDEAHYPDETIEWAAVEDGRAAIAAAVRRFGEQKGKTQQ